MKHFIRTPRLSCARPTDDVRRAQSSHPSSATPTCPSSTVDSPLVARKSQRVGRPASQVTAPVYCPRSGDCDFMSSSPATRESTGRVSEGSRKPLRSPPPSSSEPESATTATPDVSVAYGMPPWSQRSSPRAREEAVSEFKKKSLRTLPYFDLTNLPLIAVLSRKPSSLVLLVNAANVPELGGGVALGSLAIGKSCDVAGTGASDPQPLPVIVKLFASKSGVDQRKVLEQFEGFTSDADLEGPARMFHKELILLDRCQIQVRQRPAGIVKLLGWGTAESYHGVVLEALAGPSLVDILLKTEVSVPAAEPAAFGGKDCAALPTRGLDFHWSGSPPPYLQLLYRFEWALQLAKIVRQVHSRRVIHKDVRAENFAFRLVPNGRSFGQIVLFDFDNSTLWRHHEHSTVPLKPSVAENDGCVNAVRHRDDLYWLNDTFANYEADLGVGCLHWPINPPQTSTVNTATVVAPEIPYCSGNSSCPSGCKAEWIRYRSQQSPWTGRGLGRSARSQDASSGCLCPLCECHNARCDIWSLGVLLCQVIDLRENGAEAVVKTCGTCHERLPPQNQSMQTWITYVTSIFDRLIFQRFGFAPVADSVILLEWSSNSREAYSAHNVRETSGRTRIPAPVAATTPRSESSAATPVVGAQSLTWLLDRRAAWQQLAQNLEEKYTALVLSMTAIDTRDRPTIHLVERLLEEIFNLLYDFLADSQVVRLPLRISTE